VVGRRAFRERGIRGYLSIVGRTLLDIETFPMLRICSAAGCSRVVFGGGTCIDHDSAERAPNAPPTRTEGTSVPERFDTAVPVFAGVDR
jgi:hypothetical protein